MDLRVGMIVAGLVVAFVAGLVNEVVRRRRLARRGRFRDRGIPVRVRVDGVWPRGRHGRYREVEVRFADADGRFVETLVLLRAAEAGAIGIWEGAELAARYLPEDPGQVMLERPAINDDRALVSVVTGVVVAVAFFAAANFV